MQPRRLKNWIIAAVLAAGPGFASDPVSPSLDTLRQAAEQGSADAQYELGILYEFGFDFPDHKAAAYAWYSKAAEQGSSLAAKRRDLVKEQLSAAELERAQSLAKPRAPAASAAAVPASETQR